jgi:hypothetical protein
MYNTTDKFAILVGGKQNIVRGDTLNRCATDLAGIGSVRNISGGSDTRLLLRGTAIVASRTTDGCYFSVWRDKHTNPRDFYTMSVKNDQLPQNFDDKSKKEYSVEYYITDGWHTFVRFVEPDISRVPPADVRPNLINRLFEHMKMDVAKQRNIDPEFDGLKYWKRFKPILEKYDRLKVAWIPIPHEYVEQYMRLREDLDDGQINEINHFAIQHVRIPTTERATIRKIIQVALNIGQYLGTTGELLSHNRLDMFVSVENQNRLSAQISYVDVEQLLRVFGVKLTWEETR